MDIKRTLLASTVLPAAFLGSACTHQVQIVAPDKPIEINLNITQEVRVKLEKDIEDLIADNPDLF